MKQKLRHKIREIRKNLHLSDEDRKMLTSNVFKHITIPPNQIIAAYEKMGSECDPKDIVEKLKRQGHQIHMPTIKESTKKLDFNGQNPNIFIIPLIAFDRQGHRLGQGGGYYDSTLSFYPNALKIGIAFAQQEVKTIPTEDHDQKLDWIITPKEAIKTL